MINVAGICEEGKRRTVAARSRTRVAPCLQIKTGAKALVRIQRAQDIATTFRHRRLFMRTLLIVTLLALAFGGIARADEAPTTPPAAEVEPTAIYGVFGDSLGDGVWAGLYGLLRRHPEIGLLRRSKVGAGLTRPDYAAWIADLPKQIEAGGITVAVVMFGTNDQQGLRDETRKGHAFGSPGWKAVYAARMDAVLGVFRAHSVDTVWVGLPIMRKDEANSAAETLNTLFSEGAARAGIPFVPTIEDFKGPDGMFAVSLPDATQRQRIVRADDGVHFTIYGYELIAGKILSAIRQSFPDAAPSNTPGGLRPAPSAQDAIPVPVRRPAPAPVPPLPDPSLGTATGTLYIDSTGAVRAD
jgi:hypothetical protein